MMRIFVGGKWYVNVTNLDESIPSFTGENDRGNNVRIRLSNGLLVEEDL